jgi:hypothetical protein
LGLCDWIDARIIVFWETKQVGRSAAILVLLACRPFLSKNHARKSSQAAHQDEDSRSGWLPEGPLGLPGAPRGRPRERPAYTRPSWKSRFFAVFFAWATPFTTAWRNVAQVALPAARQTADFTQKNESFSLHRPTRLKQERQKYPWNRAKVAIPATSERPAQTPALQVGVRPDHEQVHEINTFSRVPETLDLASSRGPAAVQLVTDGAMGSLKRTLLLVKQLPAVKGLSLMARNARRRSRRTVDAIAL